MNHTPARLVAIDLDGTLLRPDRTVAPRVAEAVRRASRRATVLLATARPPRSMRSFVAHLGLSGPQVVYNGAATWDCTRGVALSHLPMDSQTVAEAIALARQLAAECVVNIESLDRWLTDGVNPRFTTETGRLFQPDVIGPLNTLQSAPVTKLMIHADTLAIDTMRPALQKRFGARVVWIRTDPDLLQAINPAAGKWAAIRTIALANGVAFRDVLTIGDNENDVEMLSEAGIGVAMTSGTDEAKRAADWIAPSNVDDGVAIALDRFVNVD